MRPTTDELDETRTEPDEATGNDRVNDPEPSDDGLHYGRAWHRYRYCHRVARPLRVLDAGCGTGRSTLWAARLNPGARVLGTDVSTTVLNVASDRARSVGLDGPIRFRAHDLVEPLPDDWGRFDFVICRNVLGRGAVMTRRLAALAQALDPAGLIRITLPSRKRGRIARDLKRAVDALASPTASADDRLALAREVVQTLRADHPIRAHVGNGRRAATTADLDRWLVGALDDQQDGNLEEAAALLERAGLTFLYAATPWRWEPDRVFAAEEWSGPLKSRIDRLAPDRLGRLIDALDPTLFDDEFALYACPTGYRPPLPTWPDTRLDDPATFDRLIPELTGLTRIDVRADAPNPSGRIAYQTITGVPGELDRMSGLLLSAIDGSSSCGAIEEQFLSRMRAGDDLSARQQRWIDLADAGLLLLRSPETY